jgi:SAM-dependent methyltransferase
VPDRLSQRLRVDRVARSAKRRLARLYRDGTPSDQWCRIVMNERIAAHLRSLMPARRSALEISGVSHSGYPWRDYTSSRYPDLDLCAPPEQLDAYDVVICEQVLEHVADPWRASRTLYDLCRPGGHVVVSTPFMIRVHPTPFDFWRFTEDGLRRLLAEAGLVVDEVGSWGSKRAVRGNLRRFPRIRPWRSLRNEADFPLVVWAFAHRAGADDATEISSA